MVEGAIFNAVTGRPLMSATVTLASRLSSPIRISLSPADEGRFRFGEFPEGDYTFLVEGESGAILYSEHIKIQPGQRVSRLVRVEPPRPAR